jgi:predicted ATPase/class 3 adenylate cyclase
MTEQHAGTALPTGTITFLLTDIEGSTRLWEKEREAMRRDLARHDAVVEEEVERHRGRMVRPRGEGDSRFAVFPLATDAVAAAAALQQRLHGERWSAALPLRVRMALHTGEADLRDGDYYGSAVNRCARLRSLAHGGQVLLSATTARLAREGLDHGISLRDLGVHHLKDLQQPEQVFQLAHPELPSEFPPLLSMEMLPNNLPVQLTSFIGREREMEEIKRILGGTRLLTLTGAGGAGKTRLALQVAADTLELYPDGAWVVELAGLTDRALVTQAVASALGVPESHGGAVVETLSAYLAPKCLLLVLDNCEHLIDACASLAETLLRRCRSLRILCTSREGLAIPGETVWLVPSLATPDAASLGTPEACRAAALSRIESARLFTERAAAAQPSFALSDQNAAAVAQICHRLDGIPLAIELAAARVKALSVEQIAARLDDRFRFLTGGSRTALPRQQTLQALIDWSYSLLTEPERTLFRRLSVFAGGWTLAAAEAVCAGDGLEGADVLELLSQLVNKSLVAVEEQRGENRYRFLETIRQYARGRLFESEETAGVADRHLALFLALAQEAERCLGGPEQREWLDRLQAEHDNLRAAMEWSRADPARQESGFRLAAALARFWYIRGMLSEGRRRLSEGLAAGGAAPAALRARALAGAALLAHAQGDYVQAPALARESLALARGAGDSGAMMAALDVGGIVAEYQEDYPRAESICEEALALARELRDTAATARALVRLGGLKRLDPDGRHPGRPLIEEGLALYRRIRHTAGIALSLRTLSLACYAEGGTAQAASLLQESIALCRTLGDKGGVAYSTLALGFLALDSGDFAEAAVRVGESHALYSEMGNKWGIAGTLGFLGYLAAHDGDLEKAARLARESLTDYRELQESTGARYAVLVLILTAEAGGRWERAAGLLAAAESMFARRVSPLWTIRPFPFDFPEHAATLKARLGEEAFIAAQEKSKSIGFMDAIAFALEEG